MQKYELSRQTLKMTIVLCLKLYNILLYTARIGYENTYDMRDIHDFNFEFSPNDCKDSTLRIHERHHASKSRLQYLITVTTCSLKTSTPLGGNEHCHSPVLLTCPVPSWNWSDSRGRFWYEICFAGRNRIEKALYRAKVSCVQNQHGISLKFIYCL